MSKRVVNFNENQYNRKLNELENQVATNNTLVDELIKATDNDVSTLSSFALGDWAKYKTGFKDVSLSLQALGLQDIYSRVKNVEMMQIVDKADGCVISKDGVLHIDKNVLRDAYTVYFNEDDYDLIDALERVTEASEGISKYLLENVLQASRKGGLVIDKSRLNGVLQQMRRSRLRG